MTDSLLDTIRSRGYWRINFQPLIKAVKILQLAKCKELVEANAVKLRGWNYPVFIYGNNKEGAIEPADNYYRCWVNVGVHKELWRFYQSAQFIHYLALREDWSKEGGRDDLNLTPGSSLGVSGSTIYQITEVMLFLSRLMQAGIYDEGVRVSITLENTEGRKLWLEDDRRVPFSYPRVTAAKSIPFEKVYEKQQIMSDPSEAAFEIVMHIFERFGWDNPPVDTVKQDQKNLLESRLFL
jgi:hypothetical protein